jgi:hypothetical protein
MTRNEVQEMAIKGFEKLIGKVLSISEVEEYLDAVNKGRSLFYNLPYKPMKVKWLEYNNDSNL